MCSAPLILKDLINSVVSLAQLVSPSMALPHEHVISMCWDTAIQTYLVGGWVVIAGYSTTPWLHLASWNLIIQDGAERSNNRKGPWLNLDPSWIMSCCRHNIDDLKLRIHSTGFMVIVLDKVSLSSIVSLLTRISDSQKLVNLYWGKTEEVFLWGWTYVGIVPEVKVWGKFTLMENLRKTVSMSGKN